MSEQSKFLQTGVLGSVVTFQLHLVPSVSGLHYYSFNSAQVAGLVLHPVNESATVQPTK
jgi:hypothetical protein